MIARHWRGLAKRNEADNYVRHLLHETFPKLKTIDGFVRSSILKRDVAAGTEFLIVTEWKSLEAIRKFAGEEAETAVVPAAVQAMMIEFDPRVHHYEVAASFPD